MRSYAFIGLAAILSWAFVSADSASDPFEGFEIVEPSWEFEIVPGEPPIVVNGTVQAVMAQLEEDYPDFASMIYHNMESLEEQDMESFEERDTGIADSQSLSKRDFSKCFNRPREAGTKAIIAGIKYLHGVPGKPVITPRTCNRVSCSENSAIVFCNDNNHVVHLGKYGDIANAAQVLVNQCTVGVGGGISLTNGQRFHGNKQNVIVQGESC